MSAGRGVELEAQLHDENDQSNGRKHRGSDREPRATAECHAGSGDADAADENGLSRAQAPAPARACQRLGRMRVAPLGNFSKCQVKVVVQREVEHGPPLRRNWGVRMFNITGRPSLKLRRTIFASKQSEGW